MTLLAHSNYVTLGNSKMGNLDLHEERKLKTRIFEKVSKEILGATNVALNDLFVIARAKARINPAVNSSPRT